MTDINPDDGFGDEPDTFDGRLAGIIRLIDTYTDETDETRRALRRAVIVRLLLSLLEDAINRAGVQLVRAAEL